MILLISEKKKLSYLRDKYRIDQRVVLKVLQNLHSFTLMSRSVYKWSENNNVK